MTRLTHPLILLLVLCMLAAPLTRPAAAASAHAAPATAAHALPAGIHRVVMIEGVTEYRLDNGLQVLLAPDDSRAQTTVNMSYRVGSRNEGPGETGMAHLLEHLLFRGSPKYPDALAEFARRGLAANGSTTVDLTNYYATFASDPDTLRWYLAWQADAMLNVRITRADLDAEMPVVRNEMERGENSPFGMLMQQVTSAAYVWHPYGRSVIGARSDVEHVGIDSLRAFYHRYYQPDNATLIVSGRFDAQQTLQWIAQEFGAIPRPSRTLPPEYTVEPVQQGARSVTLRRIGGSPIALAQYHLPEAASDAYTALSIGTAMLADSPAGPLYQSLVAQGLASNVFGFARAMKHPGYAVFGAQIQPGSDPQAALSALERGLETDGIGQLDQAALERIRTAWLNDWKQTYNQSTALAQALSDAVARGDWRLFFIERLRVQALTLDAVQAQLRAWLLPSNRTSGLYLPTPDPKDAPAPAPADLTPWIKQLATDTGRPAVAAFDTRPLAIDAATRRSILTLPNGPIALALLPKETAGGQVYAVLRMGFGDAKALRGLGLTPFATSAMLLRGAAGMNRQQIEDRLNALDAELSFSSDGNVLDVSLRSDRDRLPEVLDLVFHLLRAPTFPEDELERLKRSLRTRMENEAASPAYLARTALRRHDQPWDPDDIRYTPTATETLAQVEGLSRDRLRQFHERFYGTGHLSMAVVGDFNPDQIEESLRTGLAGWQAAPAYERLPNPWYAMQPETLHIPAPGKANAEYRAVLPLQLRDTDPRWPALMLANYLIGGSEDSRLWQGIRVRGGLSYGVGSTLSASSFEESGTWSLFASTAARNVDNLRTAVRTVLDDVLKTGFTQAEVDQGVQSLLNYLELGRSNDAYLTGRWIDYLDTHRSFAWQQHIIDQLRSLQAGQVNAAMRDLLHPDALSIAVAADPDPQP
ncbi:MAG: pitrilysin family protein [Castellaniella sp.]|uniref:M16 family metallopeptidase n=1 Tax=Castellaniella sp. TaxID=1955812 RepID=UPI002A36168D|nr:pitrilysin family protein [Castellaniella sp.]MDY0310294.1 pitrilysin family protein [Castellaniella sp.]